MKSHFGVVFQGQSVFEWIPNIGPNGIPEYYLQEEIDQIKYQIIQTLSFK